MMKCAAILGAVMLISACGSTDRQAAASPGGIWFGQVRSYITGQGLIDEQGNGYLVVTRNAVGVAVYRVALQPDGSNLSGIYTGLPLLSGSLPDGLPADHGTVAGIVSPQSVITGELTVPVTIIPSGGLGFNVSFNALYNSAAAIKTITGSYQTSIQTTTTDASGPAAGSLQVGADGRFTLQDGAGCTLAATFTVPNPQFNDYEFDGSNSCGETVTAVSGFAYFTPATKPGDGGARTPASLTIEYDDGKSFAAYGTASVPVPMS